MAIGSIRSILMITIFLSWHLAKAGVSECEFLFKTFTLKVELSDLKINSLEDLSSVVANLRKYAIPNLTYAQEHPEKAAVTISKVGRLDHAYVVIFNNSTYMNWALGRIAMFQTQRKMISNTALTRTNSQVQSFGGHDISHDLVSEFQKMREHVSSQSDPQSPKLQVEAAFWNEVILPILKRDPKATIIAGSLDVHLKKVISHEILHATFYERPEIKEKIEQFWQTEVSGADKAQYLEILKREKYDIQNRELVMNEFLAYTLEDGKGLVFPERLVGKYRKHLANYLD